MNSRPRSTLRLATALTVELPLAWIAFQFLLAIFAVLKIPQRNLFMAWNQFTVSRTRSRITSATRGSVPAADAYQTRRPFRSVGFRQVDRPAANRSCTR